MQWILRKIGLGHKKREKRKSVLNWSRVPGDIIHEILLRLPVKSLVRFKAVSKQWHASISDLRFVKLHANQANKGYNVNYIHLSNEARFHSTAKKSDERHSVSVTSINSGDVEIKEVEIDYPFEYPPDNVVLGSCNGLLLIGGSIECFLWNPTTKERKIFPFELIERKGIIIIPERGNHNWRPHKHYISGLGYDSSLDEYKAVILAVNLGIYGLSVEKYMFIFGSRTGNWKEVGIDHDFPISTYSFGSSSIGLTVNGAPHWMVSRSDEGICNRILYFDMADEKFKKLPRPGSMSMDDMSTVKMTVLEGCLCLIHNYICDQHFSIWAMKEHGVKDSWTKLFVIPRFRLHLVPMGFIKKGCELVLQSDNVNLATYNLKTTKDSVIANKAYGLEPFRLDNIYNFDVAAAYVGSLVSP